LLIYQAESREFERQRLVFDAITHSLLGAATADQESETGESS
jgi:hypothetical protein